MLSQNSSQLVPLSLFPANIQGGARLDIAMNGFWGGHFERYYVDVHVFNPYAPSNANISSAYRHHENIKRHAYGQ